MTATRFANNANTTLGSAASPSATAITVASGTGAAFPTLALGQYFMATLSATSTGLPNEIVKVTARTGDTMTVVRAQEGTTAQAWTVGDRFSNFVTAGFLNSLIDSSSLQGQAGNYAADTGTANAGVVTLSPAPVNLAALLGVPIRVKKGVATSTGAYTLNVNALGNVAVLIGGLPFEGGELVPNEIFEVVYDGVQFNLISNPGVLSGDRLADNSISNVSLETMASNTLKGNLGGSTATPYDVPVSALATALAVGVIHSNADGYWAYFGETLVQRGRTGPTYSQQSVSIDFPVAFADTNYDLQLTAVIPSAGDYDNYPQEISGTRTTTGVQIYVQDPSSGGTGTLTGVNWRAEGQA